MAVELGWRKMKKLKEVACEKCGGKDLDARWFAASEAHFWWSEGDRHWSPAQPERMVRICRKCSHRWTEWLEWVYPDVPRPEMKKTFRWWNPLTWGDED